MSSWIQKCPECGLVAPSVEGPRTISREYLDSVEYKTCRGRKFKSALSHWFYQYLLIADKEGFMDECMYGALRAAWACDDRYDKENAIHCRELVLLTSEWLIDYLGQPSENAANWRNEILLIRADVLRRLGRFEQLIDEYEDLISLKVRTVQN